MTIESTPAPTTTDRAAFEAELAELRVREKAHTRAGDAIAAARRRLPVVEVEAGTTLMGPNGPIPLITSPTPCSARAHTTSVRYHRFMNWTMPWYSAQQSLGPTADPPPTGHESTPAVLMTSPGVVA